MKHSSHHDPFPRGASRTDAIKHRLREKLKAQRAEEEEMKMQEAEAKMQEARSEMQSPNYNNQIPTKLQTPNSKLQTPNSKAEEIALKPIDENPPTGEENRDEENREAEVEKGLEAIYMDSKKGKALPDLTKIERRRSAWWLWAIIGLATIGALLSLAAWAGFFLARPFQEYRGNGLAVSMSGPSEIALGREETFTVAWGNDDRSPLVSADLRLGLPQDFIVTAFDPEPTAAETRKWDLGFLPVGTRGEIKVKGVFIGALGTVSAIQTVATFRPTGFEKDFQALATLPVTYKETMLTGNFVAPPKVVAGDAVTLTYEVANRGATGMEGLLARIRYPTGFVPNMPPGTELDLADREVFLAFPKLGARVTATVALVGSFASGVSGDMEFLAEAGRRGSDGTFLPSQRTEARVPVLAGDLTLRLVVNGGDTDRTILPGDQVRITVGYQNTSPEPLKDVTLRLAFESEVNGVSATGTSLLDWTRIIDASNGASSTRPRVQTLSYTKDQLPALAELAPQSQGTIEVSLPTREAASGTRSALVRVKLDGRVGMVGATQVNRAVRAEPIALRYRSDASFSSEAWYFTEEGAPLGFGPLPPVVGKTTAYRITWRIAKTLHPLQDLKVKATLPKIVAWSARTFPEAGEVAYDEAARTVTWSLNQMPEAVKELEASFEIQLTPQSVDEGRFAALLGDAKLEAADPVVQEKIVLSRPALSTDLQNDEGARGKGVVKKE